MNQDRKITSIKKHACVTTRIIGLFIVSLLLGTTILPSSESEHVTQPAASSGPLITTGQILVAPLNSHMTYLISPTGAVNHTWTSSYNPGQAVRWLGNGTILRSIQVSGLREGGEGGGVQKILWDGTIAWDYRYNTNGHRSHHDIMPLSNGNVLMIAWETKTRTEAIAAGRNPSHVSTQGMMPDHIIEVHPTGSTSGTIVWEWHAWDHLIQDYDASKANYGVVANHPELIDVNFQTSTQTDWMHTNSIDYNPIFDQILISVHNFNEIWVIDHSTTTAQAAGHTGGNSGKGGDLLYRWGNPQAYRAGTSSNEKLYNQHDATWIKPGYPGAGDLLIFNNGANRPGSHYSTIDEITPPVNSTGVYYLTPGSAYGPTSQTWIYTASPPTSFYASHISGATRLSNGDTLICNGETGVFFEVTPAGATVWSYTNTHPSQGSQVFKIVYIPSEEPPTPHIPNLDCTGSLSWTNVQPGATVTGSFQVQNIGDAGSLLNWTITSAPTWGTWTFTPQSGQNLTPEAGPVTVHVSMRAPNETNSEYEGTIRAENQNDPTDSDTVTAYLHTAGPEVPNLTCTGSLSWTNIQPGATVTGSFQVQNIGEVASVLNWIINVSSIEWGTWTFTPQSGQNLTPDDGPITINVSVIAPSQENTEFQGEIRVENQNNPADYDVIPVYLKTPVDSHGDQTMHHPLFYLLWQRFALLWNHFHLWLFTLIPR